MIKGAIFDMDGVLVDNSDIHMEAFAQMARSYGVELTKADFNDLFGRGNRDIIVRLFSKELIERLGIDAMAREKEALYRRIYAHTIKPLNGLKEFLENLNDSDVKCAVGSSGPKENVAFVLEKCGIADCFSVQINGDMVTRCKPDPEIFLTAVTKLVLPAAECVVFEDSIAGMTAARAAGTKVVAVATSLTKEAILEQITPDDIISDFSEMSIERLGRL